MDINGIGFGRGYNPNVSLSGRGIAEQGTPVEDGDENSAATVEAAVPTAAERLTTLPRDIRSVVARRFELLRAQRHINGRAAVRVSFSLEDGELNIDVQASGLDADGVSSVRSAIRYFIEDNQIEAAMQEQGRTSLDPILITG